MKNWCGLKLKGERKSILISGRNCALQNFCHLHHHHQCQFPNQYQEKNLARMSNVSCAPADFFMTRKGLLHTVYHAEEESASYTISLSNVINVRTNYVLTRNIWRTVITVTVISFEKFQEAYAIPFVLDSGNLFFKVSVYGHIMWLQFTIAINILSYIISSLEILQEYFTLHAR